MWVFGRVERLQQRLRVMIYIGNFSDHTRTIGPQLKAIISASMSIRNSEKLKKILEIILAFGNYMNSGKRGSVYGFKLTSLEALVETKSTDKSQNLLHYICNVVHSYFSEFADFMLEIRYVEQAAKVSLDQAVREVSDLKKGMDTTRKEYEAHQNQVLGAFLAEAGNRVEALEQDALEAQEAFRKCVVYFGETSKTMPPDTFFPMFDRFIKAYDKAETDLKKWEMIQKKKIEKLEAARSAAMAQQKAEEAQAEKAQTEKDMINDIRENRRRDRRAPADGALEANMKQLEKEPYRRADAVSRSFRRRQAGRADNVKKGASTML